MGYAIPNLASGAMHAGYAPRSGGGSDWANILAMLVGGAPVSDDAPKTAAVGQTLPPELKASTEPSKYLVADENAPLPGDTNPDLQGPLINRSQYDQAKDAGETPPILGRKWEEGLAPSENFETQADAMAKPRAPTYGGKVLKDSDQQLSSELQRAQEEYKLALDKSNEFGGRFMGTGRNRVAAAKAKVEMLSGMLASRTGEQHQLGDTIVQRPADETEFKTVAARGERVSPGQGIYDPVTKKTEVPIPEAPAEDKEKWTRGIDSQGEYFVSQPDRDGKTRTVRTGNKPHVPGELESRAANKPIKRRQEVVDEKTGEARLEEWLADPNTGKEVPGSRYSVGKSKVGGPKSAKLPPNFAKSHGDMQAGKAPTTPEFVKSSPVDRVFRDPDDGKLKKVVIGGNGEKTTIPVAE